MNQFPVELLSNAISIILLVVLLYKYIQYKKTLDQIKKLDKLKSEGKLTQVDLEYIRKNEYEFKTKFITSELNAKYSNAVFILIGGILFIMLDFNEAMIHLNVIVVAFIFMQVDKLHKKNLHGFFSELKK